jgi:2-haloacid dehalogenase
VTQPPTVVAFDVIGTLMSLEPLRDSLPSPDLLDAWYARTIRDGMALAVTGRYADFPDVAAAALRGLTRYTISDADVARAIAGLAELPAFPDAAPALKLLAEADIRVLCLTNGTARFTGAFLDRAGLRRYVERVVSVGDVGRWKPSAFVYRFAAELAQVPPEQVALVAAHDWDCHGAKAAGLTTGWVSRDAGGYSPVFLPPDVTGADLPEVVTALLDPAES